jgi:glycosyltransferase involved in cell wall biosynthesis
VRIGLNLLFLVPGETGGSEIYVRETVPQLARLHGEEIVAFVNREAADIDLGPGVKIVPVDVSGRGRFGRVLAEERRLPKLVREHGIELLHSLGTTAPAKPGCVNVVTILDVIYARFPEAHTFAMRMGMRILVPRAARAAERVITISEYAADDIAEVLGFPRERIDVTYLGGRLPGIATPEAELRERFELGDAPLVLSVSARRPHKNLPRLLRAFAAVSSDAAPILILPGYKTAFEDEIEREARDLGIEDRVRFLGWVSDEELDGLYAASTCAVFPSLAEGFGLPVLEAMQRGVPIASSDAASMPEVGGEAVAYFDPLDVPAMTAAIQDLLSDAGLREKLAAAGLEQARKFSWEATAQATLASYETARVERARK